MIAPTQEGSAITAITANHKLLFAIEITAGICLLAMAFGIGPFDSWSLWVIVPAVVCVVAQKLNPQRQRARNSSSSNGTDGRSSGSSSSCSGDGGACG